MTAKADIIVLGAGIVGVSTAVHLAQRGLQTVLIDRRDPGEETSFGNAGLIQREGVMPYHFPLEISELARHGLNQSVDSHYHLSSLLQVAPFLAKYWWNSLPARYKQIVDVYSKLIEHSVSEHAKLIEAAGAEEFVKKDGWVRAFRSQKGADKAYADAEWISREYGVRSEVLSPDQLAQKEPGLTEKMAGGLHWLDPWTLNDPHGLTMAYLRYFESLGGKFVKGDASTLAPSDPGWQVKTASETIHAHQVVVALGPWSKAVVQKMGIDLPLFVKRGYHVHYEPIEGHQLEHPVFDSDGGYLLVPMRAGIRLTTGAEFGLLEAAPTPVQVDRAEKLARNMMPLGKRVEAAPWMGARPCTPDMMPIIGQAPGHQDVWFAFGHAHHGLTLAAVTGRMIAEMIKGEETFVDARPFGAQRFLSGLSARRA